MRGGLLKQHFCLQAGSVKLPTTPTTESWIAELSEIICIVRLFAQRERTCSSIILVHTVPQQPWYGHPQRYLIA